MMSLIIVMVADVNPVAPPYSYVATACLFSGLLLLGAGFFTYDRKDGMFGKFARFSTIAGWLVFGTYWTMQVPVYLSLHPEDPINVILYAPALTLFCVFCFHEYDSYLTKKTKPALKFMTGMTFLAAGIYFLFEKVPQFSVGLIWAVAAQTSWLFNLTGVYSYVGEAFIDPTTGEVAVPILGTGISIILACTAIEAIVIFLGAFLCIKPEKDPWKSFKKITPKMEKYRKMSPGERRARALLYTLPPIWVLNLVRNFSIIYLVTNNITDFDTAHGYLGKSFSFLVLLGLAMITFDLMPEVYDNLVALYRLGAPPKKKKEDMAAVQHGSTAAGDREKWKPLNKDKDRHDKDPDDGGRRKRNRKSSGGDGSEMSKNAHAGLKNGEE